MRSTRSFSRGRTSERGFVIIAALALAILYFALMELMLIDSSRALHEAQRFRSRVIAAAMAESGAEMAAARMTDLASATARMKDAQGEIAGTYSRGRERFEIVGNASASGVPPASATVLIEGRILGNRIVIDYARHSQ